MAGDPVRCPVSGRSRAGARMTSEELATTSRSTGCNILIVAGNRRGHVELGSGANRGSRLEPDKACHAPAVWRSLGRLMRTVVINADSQVIAIGEMQMMSQTVSIAPCDRISCQILIHER